MKVLEEVIIRATDDGDLQDSDIRHHNGPVTWRHEAAALRNYFARNIFDRVPAWL